MKLFHWDKDGGPESTVSGLFLIEIKDLFSIVLLRFGPGTREAYHEHAFNSWSVVLKGKLVEHLHSGEQNIYWAGDTVTTLRKTFHKVFSIGTSWVISFRGPWTKTWREYQGGQYRTLTHGREEVVE